MAITKLPSGRYQAKVIGRDRRWTTDSFDRRADAEKWEAEQKQLSRTGQLPSAAGRALTFDGYFREWLKVLANRTTAAWRINLESYYRNHVGPVLGSRRMQQITERDVSDVLTRMAGERLSAQMRLHVYNLLRKAFTDAEEIFRVVTRNPVHRSFRPQVAVREAAFLPVAEVQRLLRHVEGKPFEVAVWLQVYLGLRVGEVQALRWEDVDLNRGTLWVRRAYSKAECVFREYPKGKRERSHRLPAELTAKLRAAWSPGATGLIVVPPGWAMLDYWHYRKAVKRYCGEVGVASIATHGLRHSSSEVWMEAGASRDDLKIHFGHRDTRTTERYVHDHGHRLDKFAKVIRLFPEANVSTEFPQETTEEAGEIRK